MSIAFVCPHCAKPLQLRDEMAGRRGKCPQCRQEIEIPATASEAGDEQSAPNGNDKGSANLLAAIARLKPNTESPGKMAARVCSFTCLLHYAMPILVIGLTAYHAIAHAAWSRNEAGTPGELIYWSVLGLGVALSIMTLCSHISLPMPAPRQAFPLSTERAPILHAAVAALCEALRVPTPELVADWDTGIALCSGKLQLGASAIGSLSDSELLGAIARELAVVRSSHRNRAARELTRLRNLMGELSAKESTLVARAREGLNVIGRPVVWPLLVLVRLLADEELRRAEFEADAIHCELVGFQGFLNTIQKQRLHAYAVTLAEADLPFQLQEKLLRANRVRTVAENLRSLPMEVQRSLLEQPVDDPQRGDYRPAWIDRITAAKKFSNPGLLTSRTPARHLIADFEAFCRDATWHDTQRRFGTKVKRRDLLADEPATT